MKEFFNMIWNGSPFWWLGALVVVLAVLAVVFFFASAIIVGTFRAIRKDMRR